MRAIDDDGHCVVSAKPFRPSRRVYEPGKLPDPAQCCGCLILVNDRGDANRLRLALSDGSSWRFARFDDGSPALAAVVQPVDIMPAVREAVRAVLPALQQSQVRVIEHAPDGQPDARVKELQEAQQVGAEAILEMADHVNRLLVQCAELMARVEYLENTALSKAQIVGAA